ncbi:type III pantothenate kinase [Candidatus Omnitrophota bacterium]
MKTLCVDIGNSCIKTAVFNGSRLLYSDEQEIGKFLRKNNAFVKYKKYNICKSLICSVVPCLNTQVVTLIKKSLDIVPLIVNKTCTISLRTLYSKKTPLGNDRVINIYGALCTFKPPFIVVSLGTAITLDLVSRDGIHQGGYILPGIAMKARALHTFTAQLPNVKVSALRKDYGIDTMSSINAGLVYGAVATVEGLINRLKSHCKGKVAVIATGGDVTAIQNYCSSFDHVVKKHTLNSLNLILHSL